MTGPGRVTGGFGTGVTTRLAERASEESLVLTASPAAAARWPGPGRATTFLALAVELVGRRLVDDDERLRLVAEAAAPTSLAEAVDEVAPTILLYQASFLGREELLVHADAAGELERWEQLDVVTSRYLAALDEAGAVDAAGALVQASLLLRDPSVAQSVRRDFERVVVDDWQQATFATNRLLAQLVGGPGGDVVVGGHPRPRARFLDEFLRRFGGDDDVVLSGVSRRQPGPPEVHLCTEADDERAVVAAVGGHVVGLESAEDSVGLEWPTVVIPECGREEVEGVVLGLARPTPLFDPHLLAGPDVPDDDERVAAAADEVRWRFALARSRATERLVLTAVPPVSPLLGDLVPDSGRRRPAR